jgi:methionyl-tRNA formyltransferase
VTASQKLQETTRKLPAEPTKAQKKKSPIYANEIKDKHQEIDIDLTEENILNGIIFSEILGKPISLRS